MREEKPLSEKEEIGDCINVGFSTEDVARAVKRLKEDVELMSFITEIGGRVIHFEDVLSIIKNKFGDFGE